jgi:hypothetical protein
LPCHHSRLQSQGPFQPLLDSFSQLQQGRGTQAHLLSTHDWHYHGSATIRPLERQPNEPTSGMLDIEVLLAALAADGPHHL